MHAEEGKTCGEADCEFFDREVKLPAHNSVAVKVVKRKPKTETKKASGQGQPQRKTKKSSLKKPKLWGGRPLG